MSSKIEVDLGILDEDIRAMALRYHALLHELSLLLRCWAAEGKSDECIEDLRVVLSEHASKLSEIEKELAEDEAETTEAIEAASVPDWSWEPVNALPEKYSGFIAVIKTCKQIVFRSDCILITETRPNHPNVAAEWQIVLAQTHLGIGDRYSEVNIHPKSVLRRMSLGPTETQMHNSVAKINLTGDCSYLKIVFNEDLKTNGIAITSLVMR